MQSCVCYLEALAMYGEGADEAADLHNFFSFMISGNIALLRVTATTQLNALFSCIISLEEKLLEG